MRWDWDTLRLGGINEILVQLYEFQFLSAN